MKKIIAKNSDDNLCRGAPGPSPCFRARARPAGLVTCHAGARTESHPPRPSEPPPLSPLFLLPVLSLSDALPLPVTRSLVTVTRTRDSRGRLRLSPSPGPGESGAIMISGHGPSFSRTRDSNYSSHLEPAGESETPSWSPGPAAAAAYVTVRRRPCTGTELEVPNLRPPAHCGGTASGTSANQVLII
jgi:hypothetical protein